MEFAKKLLLFSVTVLLAGIPVSCTSADSATGSYDSKSVYNQPLYSTIARQSMTYEGVERNPVIVIHGFLGAKLKNYRTGGIVWGEFKGVDIIKGYSNEQLKSLSVPMEIGKSLKELRNEVRPFSILNNVDVKILGMHFNIDAYDRMLEILEKAGYVPDFKPLPQGKHFASLFVFYYDWRRDLPENAAKLHEFIIQKRAYMQGQYKKVYGLADYDVQFDVVAHSMGGLLTRYYLEYGNQDLPEDGLMPILDWRGSKHVDKVVIVATPNAGYLDTFVEMQEGLSIAPELPAYPPGVIGTFHTYYQMLPLLYTRSVVYKDNPKGPAVNLFDPDVWEKMKWGLLNPKQDQFLKILLPNAKTPEERHAIALDHLKKCLSRAKQFTDALQVESTPPDDVSMYLFLGDSVPTRRVAEVDRNTGAFTVTGFEAGDGKVLASSARMDEREGREWTYFFSSPIKWKTVMHIFAAHMGITGSKEFEDNVCYYLMEGAGGKQAEKKKKASTK